jgi:O-antigen/teichoic acid export membrane protein
MSVEHIAKNTGFLLLGRIAEKATQFFVLVLVARSVSLEAYGTYSLVVYFTALCTILFDWGIQPYSIREVARDPSQALLFFRHGVALKSIYAISAFGLISVTLLLMRYPQAVWRAIVIVLIGRLLLSFAQFSGALFRANGKMHYEAAMAVGGSAVLLAATFVSLRFHFGVLGLAVAWLLYGFTELTVSFTLLLTRILSRRAFSPTPIQRPFLREMNRKSFVFGLCSACTLIYFYLDTVMLSKMASLETVSRYTAAYNVVFALILLPQVLVDTLFPFLSRCYLGEGRPIANVVSTISRYFLLIVIPLGFGGMLLAAPLIRFLYGERYLSGGLGADRALAILVWDACLIFFTYFYGQVLAVYGKQSRVTLIAGIGALINITLNLILIPQFSLLGAAAATVTTEFINLVLLVLFLKSLGIFGKATMPLVQPAVGTLCMGIFLWQFGAQLPLGFSVTCAVAIYGLVLLLTGAFRESDLMLLRRRLS